jgi:hypothetical protein
MAGSFSYVELHTQAPARAKDFYRGLFGWKTSDKEIPGMGVYTSIEQTSGPAGGVMATQVPQQPSAWTVYMDVPDLAEATQQVKTLGGQVLQPHVEVPGQGAFAVVADPTGAVFNLWQKAA